MDAVLGAEECHRGIRGYLPWGRRPLELRAQAREQRVRTLQQLRIVCRAAQRAQRRLLQQTDRVPSAELEPLWIDVGEQLRTPERPRPSIVVRELGERRQRFRNPHGKLLNRTI